MVIGHLIKLRANISDEPMNEKQRQGYITGIICFIVASVLIILVHNFEWNTSGQTLWLLTIIFGVFGIGSLWKPESMGNVITGLLERLSQKKDTSESHNIQNQSTGSIQATASHNARINIHMSAKDSETLRAYSQIHTMILRINRIIPRENALQFTTEGFVKASSIDHETISSIFNQHSDKFQSKDVEMWLDIEQQIHEIGGFYVGKDRQLWFDEMEAEYNRLRAQAS
jgi:hypothetical protein